MRIFTNVSWYIKIPFSENSFTKLLLVTTIIEFQRYGLLKEPTKHKHIRIVLYIFIATISPVIVSNYFKWSLEKIQKIWSSELQDECEILSFQLVYVNMGSVIVG